VTRRPRRTVSARGWARAGCQWALGALWLFGPSLHAQEIAASLALGAARVRFADQAAFTSQTLSPAFTLRTAAASWSVYATFAQVSGAGWSSQGGTQASLFSPVSRRGLMLEGAGTLGGSSFPGGISTSQGIASGRLHWLAGAGSLWGGLAAGGMFDGTTWRSVRQAEVGATLSGASQRLTLLASPTVTDDSLRYTDLLAVFGTAFAAVDVSASLGGRSGAALPIVGGDRRVWGGAQLQWWWRPRAAFVLGAGTYPVDATQGFPAGEYVSVGVKLGERRTLTALAQTLARETRRAARAGGVEEFRARVADDGSLSIRVRARGATRVDVSGDLTQWQARALKRGTDGWWWIRLPRGDARVVELALRVNGGAWIAPPGTEPLRDEFGGASGRLVLDPSM
jgi:hypothetical protein